MTALIGGPGDDVFDTVLGDGVTTVHGGGGVDTLTADWSAATAPMTLASGAALYRTAGTIGATGQTLTFDGIQNLNVTGGSGDDRLEDGFGTNVLNGGGGNDTFESFGVDTVDGGAGQNTWLGIYWYTGADQTFNQTGPRSFTLSNGTSVVNCDYFQIYTGSGNDTINLTRVPTWALQVVEAGGGDNTLNVDLSSTHDAIRVDLDPQPNFSSFKAITDLVTGGSDIFNNVQHLTVKAGSGDDVFQLGLQSCTYDGGAGQDLAWVRGLRSAFTITTDSSHVTTLQGLGMTARLTHIEHVRFDDQTVSLVPTASADSLSVSFMTQLKVPTATLLLNDTDPDGYPLVVTAVGGALHGSVSLANGQVTFTPFVGFAGAASFTYTVDDGHGGAAVGLVSVNVTGNSPAYLYRGGQGSETIDFTGDGKYHAVAVGSGDTLVYAGTGGSSVRLGAGAGVVIGGTGTDIITFGPGLGTVTGGLGSDVFIFEKGAIADPLNHGGHYDTITDFAGWGQNFIYLRGFARTASITYEHDLVGDPSAHLYRIDDGAYHAEFVLQSAVAGANPVTGQFGFL